MILVRKNNLSGSVDSMQPLCQSSPEATPKIPMNGTGMFYLML